MLIYRIGTTAFPVWDGTGASIVGGRWNDVGTPAIYTAGALSLAMLERLVQRERLRWTVVVEARVPDDLDIEDAFRDPPLGWLDKLSRTARARGTEWLASGRTALLRVPSVIVQREPNYVVNPAHPDAGSIVVTAPEPLIWDERLFGIAR